MSTKPREGWADALRVCAMVAVVLLHCAVLPIGSEVPGDARFWIINLLDGGVRWCVPVFVMLSGAFLLDPERELTTRQWLAHVGRLAVLTVFWTYLYGLWQFRGVHKGLEWLLEALIALVAGRFYAHLWFLPMLLGLYLLLPLLRAFVKGADRKTLWYAAGLWTLVVPGLDVVFQVCPDLVGRGWFNALDLRHLFGYGGYFLWGYVLRTCQVRPKRAWGLYAAGLLAQLFTWGSTRWASGVSGRFNGAFYGYLTLNVCLAALAVFLAFRRLGVGKHPLWGKLSALTLGAYAVHYAVMECLAHWDLPPAGWNLALSIPLRCLLVTLLSLGLAWVLRKLPRVGKLIA